MRADDEQSLTSCTLAEFKELEAQTRDAILARLDAWRAKESLATPAPSDNAYARRRAKASGFPEKAAQGEVSRYSFSTRKLNRENIK
jgi:hypothetical protein